MNKVSTALIAGLFFAFFLNSSCGTKYAREIANVDTLQVLISKSEADLKTVDTIKVANVYKKGQGNITLIQKNYKDTLTPEVAEFLSEYNSAIQALNTIRQQYPVLQKEIAFSKDQLKNIRHDLEYNILKEEQVKESYAKENDAVKKNMESLRVLMTVIKDKMELLGKDSIRINQMLQQARKN